MISKDGICGSCLNEALASASPLSIHWNCAILLRSDKEGFVITTEMRKLRYSVIRPRPQTDPLSTLLPNSSQLWTSSRAGVQLDLTIERRMCFLFARWEEAILF
jgi:hypothetical protein